MAGLTLDSGALIAFERGERRVIAYLKEARRGGAPVTVPTATVAEVWRGGPRAARLSMLPDACIVEPLSDRVARTAGQVIAAVRGATPIDAIVVASAAVRGDRVLTPDPEGLLRLAAHLPQVRVLAL